MAPRKPVPTELAERALDLALVRKVTRFLRVGSVALVATLEPWKSGDPTIVFRS